MALTDWPSVILVVEVTGKKLENSQPDSAKPEEPWQRVQNSYILNMLSCVTSGTIHDLAEGCLRGAIHEPAEGHLNKTRSTCNTGAIHDPVKGHLCAHS